MRGLVFLLGAASIRTQLGFCSALIALLVQNLKNAIKAAESNPSMAVAQLQRVRERQPGVLFSFPWAMVTAMVTKTVPLAVRQKVNKWTPGYGHGTPGVTTFP